MYQDNKKQILQRKRKMFFQLCLVCVWVSIWKKNLRNASCGRNEQVVGLLLLAHVEQGGGKKELSGVRVPVTPRRQHPSKRFGFNFNQEHIISQTREYKWK